MDFAMVFASTFSCARLRVAAGVESRETSGMNVCQLESMIRLIEMHWLAQVSAGTPVDDIGGNTIEQVWDRPWPWPMWLTIVIVLAVCAAVGALYYSERGRASRLRRSVLAALR